MTAVRPVLAAAALLVAGCQFAPKYVRPDPGAPEAWRTAPAPASTNTAADVAWWTFYRDPVLVQLIGLALTNNADVRIAAARLEEAAAGWRAQRSALLPTIEAQADGARSRAGDVPPVPGAIGEQYNLFGLLSYELDVWGRVRNLTAAARAQVLATAEAKRTVEIGIVAAVASTYFDLRSLDEQLAIANRTLESRTATRELTLAKFDGGNGIVSELDVRQADTQVYSARAAVARLERGIAVAENALSFLLGRNPGSVPRGAVAMPFPEEIPAGLPSTLLLRRPDILAAEQALIAENARIGAARAAYFPTISLTAALGLQSGELDNLFDASLSKSWTFAPRAAMPLFDAGRTGANVDAAKARRAAAVAGYEQAVQNAFREVEDALVSAAKLRDQLAAEEATAAAEAKRLELSTLRYEGGVAAFSEVLDAQRFLFNAELQVAQTRRDHQVALVQLYKALGGGWARAGR